VRERGHSFKRKEKREIEEYAVRKGRGLNGKDLTINRKHRSKAHTCITANANLQKQQANDEKSCQISIPVMRLHGGAEYQGGFPIQGL
jgi:hypothetical protein